MSLDLTNATQENYLKQFHIQGAPELCIVTGINGSGKSILLTSIGNGAVEIKRDGVQIGKTRILSFNSNAFTNYRPIFRGGHNVVAPNPISYHETFRRMHFNVDSNQTIIDELKKESGLNDEEITEEMREAIDRRDHSRLSTILNSLQFKSYSHNISRSLKDFYDAQVARHMTRGAKNDGRETPDLAEPYDVESMLNSILRKLKLGYEIYGGEEYKKYQIDNRWRILGASVARDQKLEDLYSEERFGIRLRNIVSDSVISIDSLSSGEKSLLSIAAIIAGELQPDAQSIKPSIILLDEPDAYLHPDYAALLINIIQEEFVDKYGFSVIMTTHSPITLAAAEVDKSITMHLGEPRLEDSQEAIRKLLAGLPHIDVLSRKNRYVFTESRNDSEVYSSVFNIIYKDVDYEFSPIFIPSSHGEGGGNCDLVKHIVGSLPADRVFHGVIDWDAKNEPSERLHVAGYKTRYSLENALFDPFTIITFLISRGHDLTMIPIINRDITVKEFITLRESHNDAVLQFTQYILPDTDVSDSIESHYIKGHTIQVPIAYMYHHGHDLETKLRAKIPQLKRYNQGLGREVIKVMREYPEIIPLDFKLLFDKILLN